MQSRSKGTRIPIKNILLVTDGAPWDDVAVLYGIDLAEQHVARLRVIHVVSSSVHDKILETDSHYDGRHEGESFMGRRTVQRERFPIALCRYSSYIISISLLLLRLEKAKRKHWAT